MELDRPQWPQKTRELCNHHFDSTIWNDFTFRDDDIIISTYAKSGTTWVQQIISQLLFNGKEGLPVAEMSPWVDLRVPPKDIKLPMLEQQTHRRCLKTHLPVDALVFSPQAKYLYIGRDGRDVLWSLYNHHARANDHWYDMLNNTPGRIGPPIEPPVSSVHTYFHDWLDNDGFPFWPYWENVKTWWDIRQLPNVMLLHYANLKQDMAGEIRRIAKFLDVDIDAANWDAILTHCSFDYMKQNGDATAPLGGTLWKDGAQSFFHKGQNRQWQERLDKTDITKYQATVTSNLDTDCAHWLETGQLPD